MPKKVAFIVFLISNMYVLCLNADTQVFIRKKNKNGIISEFPYPELTLIKIVYLMEKRIIVNNSFNTDNYEKGPAVFNICRHYSTQ
jgi:hypothetical protein